MMDHVALHLLQLKLFVLPHWRICYFKVPSAGIGAAGGIARELLDIVLELRARGQRREFIQ